MPTLEARLKNIKMLIMDVDGVLTDGRIVVDHSGQEIKVFDVRDGLGIVLFRKAGFKTAILSARSSPAVLARAKDLKIDKICQDAFPKIDVYHRLLKETGLRDSEVCFIGDDLPDLAVLKQVGLAVTVPEAVPEVKNCAHIITKHSGGAGAVREIIERILKAQRQWKKILKMF